MTVAKPVTSLRIALKRKNKKERRTSRKERRARDTSRRSMVKLTLVRNGTPMRRVLAQMKNKDWQTLPFKNPRYQGSSPTSSMTPSLPLVSWQKGTRYICLMQISFLKEANTGSSSALRRKGSKHQPTRCLSDRLKHQPKWFLTYR
jgi:hypothetical protein